MSLPDPAPVLSLIEAFRRSKTMFAAVETGVFDALEAAPASCAELAARAGVLAEPLERLLDACVALGLLEKEGGRYRNAPLAAAYLCKSSPYSLAGYALYSNQALFPMWSHLEDALREGTHRWKQTFGPDVPIFSHFFRTGQAKRDFIAGMHGIGMLCSPAVVEAFDLSGFRRLVDLGGATGHLAIAACRRYPALRAAVFELPEVAPLAREFVVAAGLVDRVEVIEGDFFSDPLPPADLYSAGRIVHDWTEPRIRLLLGKVAGALPAGGGLLLAEMLLEDDKRGPVSAHMQSVNMLICTEGKERSAAEYRQLLARCGFGRVEARTTGTPLDAVLARKM